MENNKEKEFESIKIIVPSFLTYDAIKFSKLEDQDIVVNFIVKHGGIIENFSKIQNASNGQIVEYNIHFKDYCYGDSATYYTIKLGEWILFDLDGDSVENFSVVKQLPENCLKMNGEIVK